MPPSISVLLAAYNAEDCLGFAIESILSQSFTNIELIIINDGSTDNTKKVLNLYCSQDPRIILIENNINLGLAASLNEGLKIAKGKYIARQDSDDYSVRNRLEIQRIFMEENPDIDLTASNCNYIDIRNNFVCKVRHFSAITDQYQHILEHGGIFPHGSAFTRCDKLFEVGGYNENLYYGQDADLWLRYLINNKKIFVLPEILYNFRIFPNYTNKKRKFHPLYHNILIQHYSQEKTPLSDNIEKMNKLDELSRLMRETYHLPLANAESEYWFSIARYSIKEYKVFTVWRKLILSIMLKDKFINHLRKIPWFIIALLPYSLTVKARNIFIFLKKTD